MKVWNKLHCLFDVRVSEQLFFVYLLYGIHHAGYDLDLLLNVSIELSKTEKSSPPVVEFLNDAKIKYLKRENFTHGHDGV